MRINLKAVDGNWYRCMESITSRDSLLTEWAELQDDVLFRVRIISEWNTLGDNELWLQKRHAVLIEFEKEDDDI